MVEGILYYYDYLGKIKGFNVGRGVWITVRYLCVSSGPPPLDDTRVQNNHKVSACHRARRLWMTQGCG